MITTDITSSFTRLLQIITNIFSVLIDDLNSIKIGNTTILKIFLGLIVARVIIGIFSNSRFGSNQDIGGRYNEKN